MCTSQIGQKYAQCTNEAKPIERIEIRFCQQKEKVKEVEWWEFGGNSSLPKYEETKRKFWSL